MSKDNNRANAPKVSRAAHVPKRVISLSAVRLPQTHRLANNIPRVWSRNRDYASCSGRVWFEQWSGNQLSWFRFSSVQESSWRALGILQRLAPFCFFSPSLRRCGPTRAVASSFLRFLDHTQRRTTVGRTSLDEWSVRRTDLYLTTHNTQ